MDVTKDNPSRTTTDNPIRIATNLASVQDRLMNIRSRIISAVDKLTTFNNQIIGEVEEPEGASDEVRQASKETSIGLIINKLDDIDNQLSELESQTGRL